MAIRACSGVLPRYHWKYPEHVHIDTNDSKFTHKSNAEELIAKVPVVEVDGDTARCTGVNELGYGHPVEYICLDNRRPHIPTPCKWCGLRFIKKGYLKE